MHLRTERNGWSLLLKQRGFEFSKDWGICLKIGQYGEIGCTLIVCFVFGKFYIPLPWRLPPSKLSFPGYGFNWEWSDFIDRDWETNN